jgi:hypothetical protein
VRHDRFGGTAVGMLTGTPYTVSFEFASAVHANEHVSGEVGWGYWRVSDAQRTVAETWWQGVSQVDQGAPIRHVGPLFLDGMLAWLNPVA